MLLDRHGSAATASLMTCESPDDTPMLHPVRNIRRAGKLLFAPDTLAAQVGLNAATELYTGSAAGPTSDGLLVGAALRIAVPAIAYAHTAIFTAFGSFLKSNSNSEDIYLVQTTTGGSSGLTSDVQFITATTVPGDRVALHFEFSAAAGAAHDYLVWHNGSVLGTTCTWQDVFGQVELIKR